MLRQRLNDNPPRPRCGQSRDRDRARAFAAVWHSPRPITEAEVARLRAALEATDAEWVFGLHDQDEARDHLQAGLRYPTQRDLAVVQASLPAGYAVTKITGRLAWPKHVDYLTHEGVYELTSNFDHAALIAKYAPKKPKIGLREIDRQLFEGTLDPLHCAELYPDTYRKHMGKFKRTYDEGLRLRVLRWEEQEERRLAAALAEQKARAERKRQAERQAELAAERERAEAAAQRLAAEQAASSAWENSPVRLSEVAEEAEREAARRARDEERERQQKEEWLAAEKAWYATYEGRAWELRWHIGAMYEDFMAGDLVPDDRTRTNMERLRVVLSVVAQQLTERLFTDERDDELMNDYNDDEALFRAAYAAEFAEIKRLAWGSPNVLLSDYIADRVPTETEFLDLLNHDVLDFYCDSDLALAFEEACRRFDARRRWADADADDTPEKLAYAVEVREWGVRYRDVIPYPAPTPSKANTKPVFEALIRASEPKPAPTTAKEANR